jgi:hypothetical protein
MSGQTEMVKQRGAVIDALLTYNPSIPHRTAAKLLFKDHPDLFKSVDSARNTLRYYTGNRGAQFRHNMEGGGHGHPRQPFTGEAMPVPTPFWDQTPFIFDTTDCLLMSDHHVPFHEEGATELSVKHGKKRGAKDVIILGDFLDHY